MSITVYTPLGMLGYGFPVNSLKAAKKNGFDVIAVDAGSTDPGAYYLGSGKSFTSRPMVKRDLKLILQAAREKKVPLIIGTAGGSGGIPHTDWLVEIFHEIVDEEDIRCKLARIDAELSKKFVHQALEEDRIIDFESVGPLTEEKINNTNRIVAQMGVQPFIKALEEGADVIIAGRAYDAAVIAAYPIWKGIDPGLSYHMGKILECGGMVALPRESDGILGTVNNDHFTIEPADPNKISAPDIVAAHTLYEKDNPFYHAFPGGSVDLTECEFTSISERVVKVTGSMYKKDPSQTIKIEGSSLVGYRNIGIFGIRDPLVIKNLDIIKKNVMKKIDNDLIGFCEPSDFKVAFHTYGLGAVMGDLEQKSLTPDEVGLVIDVVAKNQEIADTIGALLRSATFHMGFENRLGNSGNLAILFTPAEFSAPECYEFSLYHLIEVDDLLEPFNIKYEEV